MCRGHAVDFIGLNPPENVVSDTDIKAMFRWSSALHNNANRLTGKPMVDWNTMYDKYSNNAPACVGDCGNHPVPVPADSPLPQLPNGVVGDKAPVMLVHNSKVYRPTIRSSPKVIPSTNQKYNQKLYSKLKDKK
jgi:hypothetical protein